MKILITGGLGGIGRPLVNWLVGGSHHTRVIDRAPDAILPGAEYAQCDITDFNALRERVEDVDAIVHLAAIISPTRGLPQDIFHINTAGTFNVYQAAAETGVSRVINVSSINTLGYNFGLVPVPLQYFPIDEDHPSFTTDPYSFSKQVCEQIGDYFWRRDHLTSLSLRLAGVYDPAGFTESRMRKFIAGLKEVLAALLVRPPEERNALVGRGLALFDATRPERAVPGAIDSLTDRTLDLVEKSPEAAAIGFTHGGHSDFWTSIDVRDVCQAIEKALQADLRGHHRLQINDSHNLAGIESEKLARLFFPEVIRRTRPLVGTESLVSIDRARALIGFEPLHSVERFYTP